MNIAVIREVSTMLIGILVLGGAGFLIYNGRGSEDQAWLIVGLVVQYFFGRATSAAAFDQAQKAYPTTTMTADRRDVRTKVEPQQDGD